MSDSEYQGLVGGSEKLALRLGCLVLVALVLVPTGCVAAGRLALKREIGRVRTLCAPENLLEIYRPDLYRRRSAQTRGTMQGSGSDTAWHLEGHPSQTLSSIPYTSVTWTRRTILFFGSTPVAAMRFYGIKADTPFVKIGIAYPSSIYNCGGAHRFYVDLFAHEFD